MLCLEPILGSEFEQRAEPDPCLNRPRPTMTASAIRHPWLGIDMTPYILGQATLQALKCLKESGERSFEKLTATLLSRLIGFPIRLCKSGYQAGIDAMADLAEIPVAMEDKRYQSGPLDLGNLEGKLAAAARTYPDLQLWVRVLPTRPSMLFPHPSGLTPSSGLTCRLLM